MCSATPGGKTTGISRGPDPAEVNSPVIVKENENEPHLLSLAFAGWLGFFTESFVCASSAVVCVKLNCFVCKQPNCSVMLLSCAVRTAQASTSAYVALLCYCALLVSTSFVMDN